MVEITAKVFGNKSTMMTYCKKSLGPDSGNVTTWLRYEASGCMTNKVYADGNGPVYTYTPNGNLATRIWARGIVTTYSYDGWNNLTNTAYSDGTPSIALAYDAMGRQVSATAAAGTTVTAYNDYGEVVSEATTGLYGKTLAHHRDAFGRARRPPEPRRPRLERVPPPHRRRKPRHASRAVRRNGRECGGRVP